MVNIHLAPDVAKAHSLLAETPPLTMVLLEFGDAADEAMALGEWLRGTVAYRETPILGIPDPQSGQQRWSHTNSPAFVSDWLTLPIDAEDAMACVHTQLIPNAAFPVAPTEDVNQSGTSYRFAFDVDDREWIITDTGNDQVRQVNPAFLEHTGFDASAVEGQPLGRVLGLDEAVSLSRAVSAHAPDGTELVVRRPRRDGGHDLMRARMRLVTRAGGDMHVTVLESHDHEAYARSILNMVAYLHFGESKNAVPQRTARVLLMAVLPLDFVGVYLASSDSREPTTTWFQETRNLPDSAVDLPDVSQPPVLQRVLKGETLIHSVDAYELGVFDGFIGRMGFAAFAGIPLLDGHGNTFGALLSGSWRSWAGDSLVPETLQAAAASFAFHLQLNKARQHAKTNSLHDDLTGLPNRILFTDRLETIIDEASRTGAMFALLFVGLDRFQSINDALGHAAGDAVLAAVGERLQANAGTADMLGRFTGGEFAIVVRDVSQRSDATGMADAFGKALAEPVVLADGAEMNVTVSIGISCQPDDATDAGNLLKCAAGAMHTATRQGGNRCCVHMPKEAQSEPSPEALESGLRVAEQNGELRLYYQPKVSTDSEDLVGMEAFIRWEHPELGLINPGLFMRVAEQNQQMTGIGEWVLRNACDATARWRERYGLSLRVGVSLTATQVAQAELAETVRAALAASGLPPEALELGVTERTCVDSVPNLQQSLQALQKLGCRVALDDFGTTPSSLAQLQQSSVDSVRLDQTFIRHIEVDYNDETTIKSTIEMAHNQRRCVLANGVASEGHVDFLRQHGCDEMQGDLFCRPLSHDNFERLLIERRRFGQRQDGVLPQ